MHRLKSRIEMIEARIDERLRVSDEEFYVETLFKMHDLNPKERIIFLALLKEEYSGDYDSLRDLNTLMDLVSFDNYEKIQNRALLEDGSKLLESGLIDYDEMITAFGGIGRSFYIVEEELHKIIHPNKTKKRKTIKLGSIIEEQDIFELLTPTTTLEDVVLDSKTEEIMKLLLQRMDKSVSHLLKQWGIIDKKRALEARILFHGHPGTGKTMTALSLAKSLKKEVLSFDCSKILSMYVGESEKNVRKIFDTYKELAHKTKSEPILLLDEADQFLGSRSSSVIGSADRSHNQMQNIFLEQIEKFEGILIATTNLLDSLDKAFSRRFDYKIEFKKPNKSQRILLWQKYLPKNATFEKKFSIDTLCELPLTGGQIKLIIKNTALKVATKEDPVFCVEDFQESANRELKSTFGESPNVGFV
jgi:SpoVK/Ycf46/Vps4 family AAA+-type ATPase